MNSRTLLDCKLLCLVTAMSVCGLCLLSSGAFAQRAQTPLEIGDMSHTVVNDRSVVVVAVTNTGPIALDASGEFTLINARGAQVGQTPVSTGQIEPQAGGVLAVPLDTLLPPGRYTATLTLIDDAADVRASSGLREIVIEGFGPEPTPEPVSSSTAVETVEDDNDAGFPSWLLLLIGLTLTVAGVGYMRMSSDQRKPPSKRPVPEVSMVRKVKMESRPVKKPATIKPLLPPRRRED